MFHSARGQATEVCLDPHRTLAYAVDELQKDIAKHLAAISEDQRDSLPPTEVAIFVVHNKLKPKLGNLPPNVRYFAAANVPAGSWICYPWYAPFPSSFRSLKMSDEIDA